MSAEWTPGDPVQFTAPVSTITTIQGGGDAAKMLGLTGDVICRVAASGAGVLVMAKIDGSPGGMCAVRLSPRMACRLATAIATVGLHMGGGDDPFCGGVTR